ncbi:MAG: endolytic transglycosylase MltG [Myxococcota bacterium]|nr:endolytic transglycosylase MltG [Myxococcota bacterium]
MSPAGSEFDFLAGDWLKRLGRIFTRVAIFEIRGGVAVLKRVEGFRPSTLKQGVSLQDGPLAWSMDTASPLICIGDVPGIDTLKKSIGAQGPHFALIPLVKDNSLYGMAFADQGGSPLPLENVGYLLRQCEQAFEKGMGVDAGESQRPAVSPQSAQTFKSTSKQQGYSGVRQPSLVESVKEKSQDNTPDLSAPTYLASDEFEEIVSEPSPPIEQAPPPVESEVHAAPPPPVAHLHVEPPPAVGAINAESVEQPRVGETHFESTLSVPKTVSAADDGASLRDEVVGEVETQVEEPAQDEEVMNADQPVDAAWEKEPSEEKLNGIITPSGVYPEHAYSAFNIRQALRFGAVFSVLAVMLVAASAYSMFKPGMLLQEQSIEVDIPPASSLHDIAHQLESQGVVASAVGFKAFARFKGVGRELRAGHYRFAMNIWTWDVLEELERGQIETVSLTFPEGLMLKEVAQIIADAELMPVEDFLKVAADKNVLAKWGIPGESAEGYLFPETYTFARDLKAEQLVGIMLEQFFEVATRLNHNKKPDAATLFEKIVLASIVEREAKNVDEMHRIAGVFKNRIEQDMRLESCATIQYVFGEPKKRLLNKDLRVESPYNTYLNEGLPPGPISNPGEKALRAAFFPEDNEYLFFLAKKDGSNQHAFSRDYKEHLLMQKRYHR